jgi:predicted metalloprotease with PDZ domain
MVDGVIIIGDVAKDSPAEKAGLQEGDTVIAINKNFSQNLSLYKVSLQNASEAINMIIARKEQLMEFKFKVKNIMKNK